MLAIRMQRTGRKGHAMFRVVVQDARLTPTSGKIVALLGNYDPHAKTATINKEQAVAYLTNGAQPSDRVARLLQSQGVALPSWVTVATKKTGAIRNADKLRRNRPVEEPAAAEETPAQAEAPAQAEESPAEPAETVDEAPKADA